MGRGIERTKIFRNRTDRGDFVSRLAELSSNGDLIVYAWSLLSNHYHILARTGRQSLARSMRKLLTGYVVNFNKRHKRSGHLFQNRYKSIVCEDDPYLLELTRYIHLNPLRAGLVENLAGLNKYSWAGHSAVLGSVNRDWQDSETILAYFGSDRKKAREQYESFVSDGIAMGRRPELVGGGLIRSLGDWSQVISQRRKGEAYSFDARLLGGSDFVDRILSEVEEREKETLRLSARKIDLADLLAKICEVENMDEWHVRSGSRQRAVVWGRKLLSQIAIRKLRYSGAEVARYLGISTSAVNKMANLEELPEVKSYIKLL